ncbi:MAG: hypothetical protein AMJ89_01095 [candidate division Zixibacteria bacterium SM23_73]|nr:MAG: hypothetical protein AMJ89_01095 [candidate division Zixibacteria bacterium SM23_73]
MKMFIAVFIILTMLGGYGCKKEKIIADELLGVWETTEPKYEGCYFEITKDEIIFKDIEGDVNFFKITKIEAEQKPDEEFITYIIKYADLEGLPFELPVLYFAGEESTIRFKNQTSIVWVKSEAD